MDTFANIAPNFLAPVWGSLRVVLVIAKNMGKFYERMTDTLGRIGDILPRLYEYQRIFSRAKHPRLSEALSVAYLDIIELCMEFRSMIKVQQKSVLKRINQPLSSSIGHKLKDAEARFRAHRKNVDKEAEVCNMIEAAEERAVVQRDRQLQEFSDRQLAKVKLLSLLSPINSVQKHDKVKSKRHPGTGLWLLEKDEYKTWDNLRSNSVLCCYGIPGCGKTILTSSIIDILSSASQFNDLSLTYHYFDYADKRTLDPVVVFGVLIRHLLQEIEIPPEVVILANQYYRDGERSPTFCDVVEIFRILVTRSRNLVLVLDGIDEVKEEDRKYIFDVLKTFIRSQSVGFKVVVSCRENAASTLCLVPRAAFSIQVTESVIETDIEGFVRHSIASLRADGDLVIRDNTLEEQIVKALIEGAKGMFLWVRFQLIELCTAETDEGLEWILNNLPKDLSETYDRILGRIIGSERQRLIKRMFCWIIGASRPLVIQELCEGIAFDINDGFWDARKIPTDIRRLVRACGNLVVIDEETEVITLAHYTVQQYIHTVGGMNDQFFHFDVNYVNRVLGEVCIAYLNFADLERQITHHTDNGIGSNMTSIQQVVSTPELSLTNHATLDIVTKINRLMHGRYRTTNIDYERHIYSSRRPAAQSEQLSDHFSLLSYVRENWLVHTAKFPPFGDWGNPRLHTMFKCLVFQKNLAFSFRPWQEDTQQSKHKKSTYPHFEMMGYALVINHCPLAQAMLNEEDRKYRSLSRLRDLFFQAANWFFGNQSDASSIIISKDMLERLNLDSGSSLNPHMVPITERPRWLYSKLITAARCGNLEVLDVLMSSCLHFGHVPFDSRSDGPVQVERLVRCHILFEAIINHQNHILVYILSEVPDLVDMLINRFTLEYDGLCFNWLEYAGIVGNLVAVNLFLGKMFTPRMVGSAVKVDHSLGRLVEVHLNPSIVQGKLALVEALLRVLASYLPDHLLNPSYRYLSLSSEVTSMIEEGVEDSYLIVAALDNVEMMAIYKKLFSHTMRPTGTGIHAYMEAIQKRRYTVVDFLNSLPEWKERKWGVQVNERGLPLAWAIAYGDEHLVKLLLSYGADPISKSTDLMDLCYTYPISLSVTAFATPLWEAIMWPSELLIELLLDHGADPNFKSVYAMQQTFSNSEEFSYCMNNTPLGLACQRNEPLVVDLLLSGGADPNLSTVSRNSESSAVIHDGSIVHINPLMLVASEYSGYGMIQSLLEAGAHLNARDENHNSALYYAITKGKHDNARLLIQAGSSFFVGEKDDISLLDVARSQKDDEMVIILEEEERARSLVRVHRTLLRSISIHHS